MSVSDNEMSSFENAAKKDLQQSKELYEQGYRSQINNKKQFIDSDAAKEKAERDQKRNAFAHVEQDYSHGGQGICSVFRILFTRLVEGLKVGAFIPSNDKDLYVTKNKDLKLGNEDAEFEGSAVKKNIENEFTEQVALDEQQGKTEKYKPKNVVEPKGSEHAQAVTSVHNKKQNQEITDSLPQDGHKFLISDAPLNIKKNENGSYSIEEAFNNAYKDQNASYTFKSEPLPGSAQFVTEVPDEIAKAVAQKNKTEATGIKVSADLDKEIPSNLDEAHRSIKNEQQKKLDAKKAQEQKKQSQVKKNEQSRKGKGRSL